MASEATKDFAVAGAVPTTPVGFSARFLGASLWDLVQMECLARTRSVVRVQSGGQVGSLFFDTGRIVHAETARSIGESAALEILGWQSGSFDTCEAAWPRAFTISTAAEGLLLRAAKGRDDSGESNLVAFPGRVSGSSAAFSVDIEAAYAAEESEARLLVDDQDWESEVTKPAGPHMGFDVDRRNTGEETVLPIAVRVAADGAVLEAVDDNLADAVAYAGRLSSLIGELLGFDGFRALECVSKDERVIIYAAEDGGLVAGRIPLATDVTVLRERLGL
jgi:Domain of unknown function (DUF4388)